MRTKVLGGALSMLCSVACMGTFDPSAQEQTPGSVVSGAGSAGASPEQPVVGVGSNGGDIETEALGAECDEGRSVESDGEALLVRDPEILKHFSLERVLQQIIATSTVSSTPLELLQRLFDTDNAQAHATFGDVVHCDDSTHPAFAQSVGPDCSRVEGRLARSQNLLQPEHLDSFVPVALVNRFDLTPLSLSTCGEYRIVYAKLSGRTDPADRAFLIFEAALGNEAGGLAGCRPVAELWANLATEQSLDARVRQLETLFFQGVTGFRPVVHVQHYGSAGNCDYAGRCGQVRLGQGMQAPWEFRQFRLNFGESPPAKVSFVPTANSGALLPQLFDASQDPLAVDTMSLLAGELRRLSVPDAARVGVLGFPGYEAGVSALEGEARPNFLTRFQANPDRVALTGGLAEYIATLEASACPPEDPITVDSTLARATAVSCAGCHAPQRFLPPERKVGCGVVWPNSLGEAHIDEQGNLSEALTNVFLPHRANVLATYLQACDVAAIRANLRPIRPIPLLK